MVNNVQCESLQGLGEITKGLVRTEMLTINLKLLKVFQDIKGYPEPLIKLVQSISLCSRCGGIQELGWEKDFDME